MCLRNLKARDESVLLVHIQLNSSCQGLLMPTVDTTPRQWPSTDRSTEIKKAIKMLSALQYLKKVGVVKAKELRTKDDASAREKLQG